MTETRVSDHAFLNVDLDFVGEEDPSPLVRAMASRASAIHSGRRNGGFHVVMELNESSEHLEEVVRRLAVLVKSLPEEARTIWNHGRVRDMNIGFQCGCWDHAQEFALSADVVRDVAEVGARIVITLYSAEGRSEEPSRRSPLPPSDGA